MSFENIIGQLEETWGSNREEWGVAEWRRAAESLEKALGMAGRLLMSQSRIIEEIHIKLADTPQIIPKKKRGRPPKKRGLNDAKKPHRSANKYDRETRLVLFAKVQSEKLRASTNGEKITDKEALFRIFRGLPKYKDRRIGLVRKEINNRLAPMLSKVKKEVSTEQELLSQLENVAMTWSRLTD